MGGKTSKGSKKQVLLSPQFQPFKRSETVGIETTSIVQRRGLPQTGRPRRCFSLCRKGNVIAGCENLF